MFFRSAANNQDIYCTRILSSVSAKGDFLSIKKAQQWINTPVTVAKQMGLISEKQRSRKSV